MKEEEKIVIVSGYFNPLHSGHVSLFKGAKKLGDKLIAIVNNDKQVKLKGTFPFMRERERKAIVGAIKYVDLAYISTDKDKTVNKTIEELHSLLKTKNNSFIFANGGKRKRNLPEYDACKKLGIKMVFDVGGIRKQSSSCLIQKTKICEKHEKALNYCDDCLREARSQKK